MTDEYIFLVLGSNFFLAMLLYHYLFNKFSNWGMHLPSAHPCNVGFSFLGKMELLDVCN